MIVRLVFEVFGGLVLLAVAVVAILLQRRRTFEPPLDKCVVFTTKRHMDALPIVAKLAAAGIDADVVEDPVKPFGQRFAHRAFVGRASEPVGPWYVVVPSSALAAAEACLAERADSVAQR